MANKPRPCWDPFNYYWGCRNVVLTDSPKDFGQGFYLTDIEEQAQNMPIAASQYWNCIHGRELREADRDEEGKQTMRVLARNMTFLMKSIELGKKQLGLPEKEEHAFTHFIR